MAEAKEQGISHAVSLRRIAICIVVASALLLVPTTDSFTPQIRYTAAVALLMALLWFSEALPMGLTALLPLVLFPAAGIQTADRIAAPYANSAVFLFLGGFLVAAAVEKWGLHRRVAWHALSTVGTEPRRLIFAVMLATALLSMWISNTATTLMLTPIAVAIVRGAGKADQTQASRMGEATLLAVAYGASLGGIGTPIGTPTNLIFLGAARELFPAAPTVTFAQWMSFGLVYLALALPACWLGLILFGRIRRGAAVPIEQLGLERPGTMTRPEATTAMVFAVTAMLWIFRSDIRFGELGTIPGWSNLFPNPRAINDATVAVIMALIGFLLPVGQGRRLLEWPEFRKVPWDVLILFGGGFALADALETSGLSRWAGEQLSFVGNWPPVLMVLVVCIGVTALSEIASNVATATAMMPVAGAVAISIGVHPYALMLPAVLAASSGFMLPVATAPNTIVYATGLVRVRQMARAGIALDLICALIITFVLFVLVPRILGIALFSPWQGR
jgi:sodium-dependent dicarboxylate transporter 2/3/5